MKAHDFCKYLRRNPGEEACGLESFSCAVVIPAYKEEESLLLTLNSVFSADLPSPVAVIVVVNHPCGCDAAKSLCLLEKLKVLTPPENVKLHTVYAPDLTNGVGEARKIGFDLFCRSRTPENAESSFMFSLDADCLVDTGYFCDVLTAFEQDNSAGGVIIPVKHQQSDDPEIERAIRSYEEYFISYERDLEWAGSPYAFQAIGSGFAVRVSDYIKCGGMKQKKAGEDFYFLQELVKCSKLVKLPNPLVHPSPRLSDRVPFGTGTAVEGIISGKPPRQVTTDAVKILKVVLDKAKTPGTLADPEKFLEELPPEAAKFFLENNFVSAWQRSTANQKLKDDTSRQRVFHLWFDGLQTRRFLHSLSER